MRSQAAAGRVIVGRYELVEPLGEGPLGPLWRAHDHEENRDVAVREVELPDLLDEAEQAALAEKVLREARTAARLTHRCVVPVFDVVADNGHPFVVTELVAAPTLADVVAQQGPLEPAQAAAIGLDVLDALGTAHDQGLVHRDVQPSNVFLTGDGRARLADFGIASLVDDPRASSSGSVVPHYLAPEQTGSAGASPASDLWSLAATVYFAVEGVPPFDEPKPVATLDAIRGRPIRPSARAGRLRPFFDVLLVKDPTMRAGRDRARALLAWAAEGAAVPFVAEPPAATPFPPPPPAPTDRVEPPQTDEVAEAPDDMATEVTATQIESAPPPPPPPPPPAPLDTEDTEAPEERFPAEEPTVVDAPDSPNGQTPAEERTAGTDGREPWFFGLPVETVPPPPRPEAELEPYEEEERKRRRLLPKGAWISLLAVVTALVMLGLLLTGGGRLEPDRPSVRSGADNPPPAAEWTPYTDDAIGFTVRYPPGWTVRRQGNQTYFVHPDRIAYLEVDHQQPPAPSPVKAWEDLEKTFAESHPSYAKIRIVPSTFQNFPAAIWEFTHTDNGVPLHTVDLGFTTPKYGFALVFQTRAGDWDRLQGLFDSFKAAFRPPA